MLMSTSAAKPRWFSMMSCIHVTPNAEKINSVEICSADVHFGAYLINAPAACRGGTNAPPKLQKLPVSENIGNLRFLRTAQLLADVEQNHSQRVIIEIAVGIVVINLLCVHGFYKIVNNNIFAQLNRLV